MRIARLRLVAQARLHQQPMLDVHVERIFGRDRMLTVRGQHFGDHIGEEVQVAAGVQRDGLDERLIELLQIVQIDGERHLIAMGQMRELGGVLERFLAVVVVGQAELGQERFDGLCAAEYFRVNCWGLIARRFQGCFLPVSWL